jgi:hypothetical protein
MVEKLTEFFASIRLAVKKTLDDMPPQKRRLVLLTAAAVLAILLLIFIFTKLSSGSGAGTGKKTGVRAPVPVPKEAWPGIPPEDLFLPDEPDFIPGVMLEREQRETWTADDAAPFWIDPLKNGEQQWRDRIEATVDKIMENVP